MASAVAFAASLWRFGLLVTCRAGITSGFGSAATEFGDIPSLYELIRAVRSTEGHVDPRVNFREGSTGPEAFVSAAVAAGEILLRLPLELVLYADDLCGLVDLLEQFLSLQGSAATDIVDVVRHAHLKTLLSRNYSVPMYWSVDDRTLAHMMLGVEVTDLLLQCDVDAELVDGVEIQVATAAALRAIGSASVPVLDSILRRAGRWGNLHVERVTEYFLADYESTICYGHELAAGMCQEAATVMGLPWAGSGLWSADPHGCFQSSSGEVYYNQHAGSDNELMRRVCGRGGRVTVRALRDIGADEPLYVLYDSPHSIDVFYSSGHLPEHPRRWSCSSNVEFMMDEDELGSRHVVGWGNGIGIYPEVPAGARASCWQHWRLLQIAAIGRQRSSLGNAQQVWLVHDELVSSLKFALDHLEKLEPAAALAETASSAFLVNFSSGLSATEQWLPLYGRLKRDVVLCQYSNMFGGTSAVHMKMQSAAETNGVFTRFTDKRVMVVNGVEHANSMWCHVEIPVEDDGQVCQSNMAMQSSPSACTHCPCKHNFDSDFGWDWYIKDFVNFLEDNRCKLQRGLLVGFGIGEMLALSREACPDSEIDVIDIDLQTIQTSFQFFGYTGWSEVFIGDATAWFHNLNKANKMWDWIAIDCAEGDYIPEACKSAELYAAVNDVLKPGGHFAQNVIAGLDESVPEWTGDLALALTGNRSAGFHRTQWWFVKKPPL